MKNTKNLIFLLLLLIGLANIALHYLAGSNIQGGLFNSDALYLPTLFSDILSKNGSFLDWFLTPAPYFFPDYFIFLPIYFIFSTTYIQIIVFSLTQTILIFLFVWYMIKGLSVPNSFKTAITITISLIWLSLTSGEPFVYMLNSAFHYGGVLASILCISLWFRYDSVQKKELKYFICSLILILSFFSTLSDNLFLVQFSVPFFSIIIFKSFLERDFSLIKKIPIVLLMFFSVLGAISYKFIIENQTRYKNSISLENVIKNYSELYTLFFNFFENNAIYSFLFLTYMLIVLYSIFNLRGGNKIYLLAIFSFLSSCATIIVVLLIDLPVTLRYFIPVFSWPIIIVFIFISNFLEKIFIIFFLIISLLLLVSLSWNSYKLIEDNKIKLHYYPEDISCIDNVLEKENLTNGIAQYWDAKYLQNFSRNNLNLAQYLGDLSEHYWITSKKYFKKNYDFAIISEDAAPGLLNSSEVLYRLNGQPKLVTKCGNKSIYIYGKNKLRVKKFNNIGDSYTWKACELPTVIGKKTAECTIEKLDNALSGYLTFGPYEPLPTGRYNFEIAYSSDQNNSDNLGQWDVVVALPNEAKVLKNGLLTTTKEKVQTVKNEFMINQEQNLKPIEIRIFVQENIDLQVSHIRVTRLQ